MPIRQGVRTEGAPRQWSKSQRHGLGWNGQQYHLGVFQRIADASHRRPAWALAGPVPGSVDHVVPGRAPLAPERSADVALADHRDLHARQQPA
jgi:hypothetical protein